jgi:hypothetical protein
MPAQAHDKGTGNPLRLSYHAHGVNLCTRGFLHTLRVLQLFTPYLSTFIRISFGFLR